MNWDDIPGWFNFDDVYGEVVQNAPDKAIIVEVGCWLGSSTAFLGQCIRDSPKEMLLYAVDTWAGSDEEEHIKQIEKLGGPEALYAQFLNNMMDCGVSDVVRPMRMTSIEASKYFLDDIVYFCYLDASHKYEDVVQDIKHWLPKIQPYGILGGHDVKWPDVRKALNECLPGWDEIADSWLYQVGKEYKKEQE